MNSFSTKNDQISNVFDNFDSSTAKPNKPVFVKDWTIKYYPKTIKDLHANEYSVKLLGEWISKFNSNKKQYFENKKETKQKRNTKKSASHLKSTALVLGNHGSGKTCSVDVLLRHYGYNVLKIQLSKFKGKDVKEYLNQLLTPTSILDMFNSNNVKKNAIMIDEIESITSTTEKKNIQEIQKINDTYWFCPVVLISNGNHNKLLTELKLCTYNVWMKVPSYDEIYKIFINVSREEQLKYNNKNVVQKIIDHSQNDIRRLLNILQDIKYENSDQKISMAMINDYCSRSKKKDVNPDLYETTAKLLYRFENINKCLKYHETEKVLLPIMMHEKYLDCVNEDIPEECRTFIIEKIAEAISDGDIVENYIYGDQNWAMQKIHGYYSCVAPSYYLSKHMPKSSYKSNRIFAKDLNKTSIKSINQKNIQKASTCFKNMNITDYIYINKIVKNLIVQSKIEECADLLEGYNADVGHIESLLKIDKIVDVKTEISTKHKKEFQRLLEK